MSFHKDEQGNRWSLHVCNTCGVEFTVCPAVSADKSGYDNCLGDDCESYDPHRDGDIMFMSDAEIAREKPLVSIAKLRERRDMRRPR